MKIKTKKIYSILILVLLITILICFKPFLNNSLKVTCFICNIFCIVGIALLAKYYKKVDNILVLIFAILLFLFSNGCCLLVSFGVNTKDIYIFSINKFTSNEILSGFLYNSLCFLMFCIGALCVDSNSKKENEPFKFQRTTDSAFRLIGTILFVVFIPIDLYFSFRKLIASAQHGFLYLYSDTFSSNSIASLLQTFSILVVPGTFLMAKGNKEKNNVLYWIPLFLLFVSATLTLLAGDRAYPFGIYISLIWFIVDNKKKKIKFKDILLIGILGYIGISAMSFMAEYRLVSNKNIGDFISQFLSFLFGFKVIVNGINETGVSIRPLLELQGLMNSGNITQTNGGSVLGMIIMFIPSIIRGDLYQIGVSKRWIGIENIISDHAGVGGLGYSLQAESYANFEIFGWLFFVLWGIIIAKILSFNCKKSVKYRYIKRTLLPGLFAAMVIITRESSLLLLKYLLIYLIVPYFLVYIFSKKGESTNI